MEEAADYSSAAEERCTNYRSGFKDAAALRRSLATSEIAGEQAIMVGKRDN